MYPDCSWTAAVYSQTYMPKFIPKSMSNSNNSTQLKATYICPSPHDSRSFMTGGTAYGQNITTATTGKYLPNNKVSKDLLEDSSNMLVIPENLHCSNTSNILPLPSPSNLSSRGATDRNAARRSVRSELLSACAVELCPSERGQNGTASNGRHSGSGRRC